MNIGIIIHSQTGHTLSVAQKLKESLTAQGHQATVAQVTGISDGSDRAHVQLTSAPDVSGYDALVFGAPVQGFALSRVMTAYMSSLPSLPRKIAALLTTQQLPFDWMGGNQAIRQMEALCAAQNAAVCGTCIIHWGNETRRDQQSSQAVIHLQAAVLLPSLI